MGFHDTKRVRKAKVERRSNDIINRLEKTRQERNPDFRAEKEVRGCGSAACRRFRLGLSSFARLNCESKHAQA